MSIDSDCMDRVNLAEDHFKSRWRESSLRRIDPELHRLIKEQESLFFNACFGINDRETKLQADALIRGWAVCVERMSALEEPDDAYLYGTDASTGTVVAIGTNLSAVSRLRLQDGHRVTFVTPDEVAKMIAGLGLIAELKQAFPETEVLHIGVSA